MATQVTPRQAVYEHLKADPAVAALVGDRIYHQLPPPDASYPLLVIYTISNVRRPDLAGVAYTETRLQITAMAPELRQAELVALSVVHGLDGYSGTMAGALSVMECKVETYMPVYQEDVGFMHYHVDVLLIHEGGA